MSRPVTNANRRARDRSGSSRQRSQGGAGRLPVLIAMALLVFVTLFASPARAAEPDIVMWGHPACPHCRAAHGFLDDLRGRRPDLRIVEHDVTQAPQSYEELRARSEQAGLDMVGLPSFVVRGRFLVGFDTAETTGRQMEALVGFSRVVQVVLGVVNVKDFFALGKGVSFRRWRASGDGS